VTTNLIKTQKDWKNLITEIKQKKFLGIEAKTIGNPEEFPCFAISQIVMDNNGVSIAFNFIYKKDAEKLLKL